MLCGLTYLHSKNQLHRDIKPANILVSCVDCSVRIADFGLSRVVEQDAVATDSSKRNSIINMNTGGKISGGSEPTDEEEGSDMDSAEMDSEIQYIQSPLPNSVFRDAQSQLDHQKQSLRGVASPLGELLPGSVFNSPTTGYPQVSKVPLKRALTKHVVSLHLFYSMINLFLYQ